MQAADTEVRPHLLRAILEDDPALQPISLCEGGPGDRESKAGEYEQGSCNVGGNCERYDEFDHLFPDTGWQRRVELDRSACSGFIFAIENVTCL